jgi:hypothetical protein
MESSGKDHRLFQVAQNLVERLLEGVWSFHRRKSPIWRWSHSFTAHGSAVSNFTTPASPHNVFAASEPQLQPKRATLGASTLVAAEL